MLNKHLLCINEVRRCALKQERSLLLDDFPSPTWGSPELLRVFAKKHFKDRSNAKHTHAALSTVFKCFKIVK